MRPLGASPDDRYRYEPHLRYLEPLTLDEALLLHDLLLRARIGHPPSPNTMQAMRRVMRFIRQRIAHLERAGEG